MVTMMNFEPSAAAQESYILCADCGTVINSTNGANLCEYSASRTYKWYRLRSMRWIGEGRADHIGVGCLRNSVDVTEGIPKEATLMFCRGCERFSSPPSAWVFAQPESRELMGELALHITHRGYADRCSSVSEKDR